MTIYVIRSKITWYWLWWKNVITFATVNFHTKIIGIDTVYDDKKLRIISVIEYELE